MSETVNIRELNELVASKNDFVNLITRAWTRQSSARNTSSNHSL